MHNILEHETNYVKGVLIYKMFPDNKSLTMKKGNFSLHLLAKPHTVSEMGPW